MESKKTEIKFFEQFKLGQGTPEKGKILISEPFSPPSIFSRSVVLLVEHDSNGSLGFILNKPSGLFVQDVLENFPPFEAEVFLGGPVERNRLYFIHTKGNDIKGSIHVKDNLYWGGNFEDLKKLIEKGEINRKEVKFFAGYSGWGSRQLQNELKRKSWIVATATVKSIMETEPKVMWNLMVKGLGENFEIMTKFPIDPTLN
ncbi:MAG: YqgE/AlgH family protein [Bacteroidetes bacterium]|nr:MAG: YqgE/AlgH family protein [Bacteroidota bacterium]